MMETVFETDIPNLKLVARGKVRDIYEDGGRLLMIATDRLSAFDVVLPDPIPSKGAVLTALSTFWFGLTKTMIPNHIIDPRPWASEPGNRVYAGLKGRAVLVKRAQAVPIEAVVRGYLAGSGWTEYSRSGTMGGMRLPPGLKESDRIPEPMFTPSTKAPLGDHDENISFEDACAVAGKETATKVRDAAVRLYVEAQKHALERGIIIADTKFEFGLCDGVLTVIDEMLTPDSSRFWPLEGYAPGRSQPSYDKQYVRDWLTKSGWDKKPPAPKLPPDVIRRTSEKYREALVKLDPSNETLELI
jgi:phosphoribosylaminoimidazole-succinocarboxamide synthase